MNQEIPVLLDRIISTVRNYRGLTRKKDISFVSSLIAENDADIIAARGEDAAVISLANQNIALAADGIMEELSEQDPYWAGYCSILVNVNDLIAVRARPKAAVNVISAKDEGSLAEIVEGMNEACEKFRVKMLGGHLHPKASRNDVSVMILGIFEKGRYILSTTAKPGEKIIVITDCIGRFTPGFPMNWDCTSMKSSQELSGNIEHIQNALDNFSSAKDISNPGLLGTLGMLLEASQIGAEISIDEIPVPSGVDLLQWLTAYQGLGIVGTAPEENIEKIVKEIHGSELSVSVIGETKGNKILSVKMGDLTKVLFDFSREKITGLF